MNEPSQRAGDTVHEVVQRYSHMVYRLAFARTGNRADADDVYQEVFLKLFASDPDFESEEHRKAWLIRTTIHVSVNLLKSAWRRRVLPAEELFGQHPPLRNPRRTPRHSEGRWAGCRKKSASSSICSTTRR